MKKLVLIDDDKCSIPMFQFDRGCFPLPSMFIELECHEDGKPIDNDANQKLINEAFTRALIERNSGKKERDINMITRACPACGNKYTQRTGIIMTLVGYVSPPGHDHDDNCKTDTYYCINGHPTTIHFRSRCSNLECQWRGKETCFCHQGVKTDEPQREDLPIIRL